MRASESPLQSADPNPHELDYQRRETGPVDEVGEAPLRNASFLTIASIPVWLSAGLFVANIYYADSIPSSLQFTRIDDGSGSFPNISAAMIHLAIIVFGGMRGLAVFVMSIRALPGARRRADWFELLLISFSFLSFPGAVYAWMLMT